VGVAANAIEVGAGKSSIGSNLKFYRNFFGNQNVSTLGIKGMANSLGFITFGAGLILDFQGVLVYNQFGADAPGAVTPQNAIANGSVGTYALLVGGSVGLTVGPMGVFVNFAYPNGWQGAIEHTSSMTSENQAILGPGFDLYRDH